VGAARDDWWKTYFQGVASEFTRRAVAPRSVADAARIERVLGLSESSTILDVPCGHGRIAIELAARGHRVTGLDFAPEEIACAKQAALERNVTIDVRVGDMRTDVPAESFDATVCFGHSFGYFTDEENAAFLRAAYGSLRPGGQFALETALCLDSYLPRLGEVSRPQWAKVGDTYLGARPKLSIL
jgi:cyclopropane fatty-acyl-phospholipid synthase-like methyltransferase